MMKRCLKTIPVILLIAATACSLTKHRGSAEAAVARFHDQYNAGQFREIYLQAAEGFKESSTETNFVETLGALKKKLGGFKHANQTRWHVNSTTAGTMVSLGYDVEFTEGKGAEEFVFVINGNKALLYKYHVNSPLLITK